MKRTMHLSFGYSDTELLIADNLTPETSAYSDTLTTAENTSGDLQFVLPKGNAAYDAIASMQSEIVIRDDDLEIWRGRVIRQEYDINMAKKITAKGILDYLHDSFVPPMDLNLAPVAMLNALIYEHNRRTPSLKHFHIGEIDMGTEVFQLDVKTPKSTWDCITEAIKSQGGYISTRREGTDNYIDWVATRPRCYQDVEYGVNLRSLTVYVDPSNVITRLYGYGKKQEDGTYVDITSMDGVPYIQDDDAVSTFGVICAAVSKLDTEDPAELKAAMQQELAGKLAEVRSIEATAMDLHDLGYAADRLEAGRTTRIVSAPHRIDEQIPIIKIQRHLWEPEKTVITLGSKRPTISNLLIQAEEVS